MIKPVVAVYDGNDIAQAYALIYYNGSWREIQPKVYSDGAWHIIGGQGRILRPLIDANNEYVYDANEELIIVKG